TLPFIPYPEDYQQTAATEDAYKSLYDTYFANVTADASQSAQLTQAYEATNPSPLTDQRTSQIITLIEDENRWPADIRALALAANDTATPIAARGLPDKFTADLSAASDACTGAPDFDACYRPRCQAAASARNAEWRADMVDWDNTERAYFAAYYRYA